MKNQKVSNFCLFCGPVAKSFIKSQHIIPESLGNTSFVLREVVCDDCNQYFSKLENYFVHHHLSSPHRLLSIDKTKKGKPPMQALVDGELRRQHDGKLNFRQPILEGREHEQLTITCLANEVILKGSFILDSADTKRLSRFLAKCALETLYFKRGTLAFAEEFNELRAYARYGRGLKFVPFLWAYQNERPCDLLLMTVEVNGIEGLFYFAAVYVPGSLYIVPLSRFDEPVAMEKLEAKYLVNKVMRAELLRREPIRYEARMGGKQTGN